MNVAVFLFFLLSMKIHKKDVERVVLFLMNGNVPLRYYNNLLFRSCHIRPRLDLNDANEMLGECVVYVCI